MHHLQRRYLLISCCVCRIDKLHVWRWGGGWVCMCARARARACVCERVGVRTRARGIYILVWFFFSFILTYFCAEPGVTAAGVCTSTDQDPGLCKKETPFGCYNSSVLESCCQSCAKFYNSQQEGTRNVNSHPTLHACTDSCFCLP